AKIMLAADVATVPADGTTEAVFTITALNSDGIALTDAGITLYVNGEALVGKRFSTDQPGTYRFHARSGSVSSNEVVVTATEVLDAAVAELQLITDRDRIIANGADTLIFEVIALNTGGDRIDSADYTIYANDTLLDSNEFITSE